MDPVYYSSGQVARLLGATLATVRTLCESRAIAAETTPGGHWRVPAAEVARLKRDGLPPIPRPLPTERASPAGNGKASHRCNRELVAATSDAVVSAADEVSINRSRLEKRKVDRELEEAEDWFRDRADQQAQREAERQEAERRRQTEVEAERVQQEWENRWLTYALNAIPSGARGEIEIDVHEQVRGVLAITTPQAPAIVVQRVVDTAVAKALRPWQRRRDAARVIERAVGDLPSAARRCFQPTEWQIRATKRAREATEVLPEVAELPEIEAAAKDAVDRVIEEYRDAELRRSKQERLRNWSRQHLTDAGMQMAEDAIDKALAAMPLGTPTAKLEAACEKALGPFRIAVAQRQAQDQDRASRESVLSLVRFNFLLGFAAEDREPALTAVREALAKLPAGTARANMDKARDEALQPFINAHQRRERKKELIDVGLREIFPYIVKLQQEWEFGGATASTLKAEVKQPIRERLEVEVTGTESEEDIRKKVRGFVREEFPEAPRH